MDGSTPGFPVLHRLPELVQTHVGWVGDATQPSRPLVFARPLVQEGGQTEGAGLLSGEGNGSPLQCSCLENPRDGGAWWAAVYGVAQSRTRLKRLSSSSSESLELRGKALQTGFLQGQRTQRVLVPEELRAGIWELNLGLRLLSAAASQWSLKPVREYDETCSRSGGRNCKLAPAAAAKEALLPRWPSSKQPFSLPLASRSLSL